MSIFKIGTYGDTMDLNRQEYESIVKKLLALRTPHGVGSTRGLILDAVRLLDIVKTEFFNEMQNQARFHPEDLKGADDADPKS